MQPDAFRAKQQSQASFGSVLTGPNRSATAMLASKGYYSVLLTICRLFISPTSVSLTIRQVNLRYS